MILWVGKGIYLYRRHLPEDLGLKETTTHDFLPNSSPMNIIHRKKKNIKASVEILKISDTQILTSSQHLTNTSSIKINTC